MDTLISLGTLLRFFTAFGHVDRQPHLYFETGAVIAALMSSWPILRSAQRVRLVRLLRS